jgi:hypothetical protein
MDIVVGLKILDDLASEIINQKSNQIANSAERDAPIWQFITRFLSATSAYASASINRIYKNCLERKNMIYNKAWQNVTCS